jgi:hypothetical protein
MAGSTVTITYDGTNITSSVLFSSARFESRANAEPGTFEFRCKDMDQTLSFTTGKEITLTIDGQLMWGGFLTQVGRVHAFEADYVPTPVSEYDSRMWVLRGVDYNVLFDRRVIRNTANYLQSIDTGLALTSIKDATILKSVLANYVDVPAGFDITTEMDDVANIGGSGNAILQQGSKLRETWERYAWFSGAAWYISPDKKFHWHALEDVESHWGFSDQPNNNGINGDTGFQGSTIGFREMDATEDGTVIVNDALIWGGTEFSGGTGGTVFARAENEASQSEHGRWQVAELHLGDTDYSQEVGVQARANAIVNGPPGADIEGQQKGLRFPQWNFRLTWFAHDVPLLGGIPDHLYPGDLVTIVMNVFEVTKLLPMRNLEISFPNLDATGKGYVRFTGTFALNMDDPFTLWKYIQKAQSRTASQTTVTSTSTFSTVTNSTSSGPAGSFYQGIPSPLPNGIIDTFSIPFGYVSGTLQVYINGINQRLGIDYLETDPTAGTFTLTTIPITTDELYVIAVTSTPSQTIPTSSNSDFMQKTASAAINISNQSNVLIQDLALQGPGTSDGVPGPIAITLSNVNGALIRYVDFADWAGGIYAVNCRNIVIEDCRGRNIGDNTIGSGHSNYVQFNNTFGGAVRRCKFKGGWTEDMISIYRSGGISTNEPMVIESNQLEGMNANVGSPTIKAWTRSSGTGIIICDGGQPNGPVVVRNNTLLRPGQVGIQTISGPSHRVYGNIVYADARGPLYSPNVGFASWEGPATTDCRITDNRVYWRNNSGSESPYWWHPDYPIAVYSPNNWSDHTIDPNDLVVNL